MSRAHITVEANEQVVIEGKTYRVTEHPALPGIPYIQRGGRGFVIQLAATNGERIALKYFKLKYRVPDLVQVADSLRQYADLPGMKAARRTVFTRQTHADLLVRYPALEYGMLMPWIPGMTWYDLVTSKAAISPQECLRLAQLTSHVLATLEEHNLAHADIAGANVIVDRQRADVELVDIEELYGPHQPPPVENPAGQDGYQHQQSRVSGQWCAAGDRFAAAILLAEMLGWADVRIRQNSADEHYFATSELQDPTSTRYRLLADTLTRVYSADLAQLLAQAWHSSTLEACPPLASWQTALNTLKVEAQSPAPIVNSSPVVSGRRTIGPAASPIDKAAATHPSVPEGVLKLEGIKLCRNCGAENTASQTFCKRCGFYIHTGTLGNRATRPRPEATQPLTQIQPPTPQPVVATHNTAPQAVPLQKDNREIITARRMGDPSGSGMQRIASPDKPQEPQVEANFGSWIIIAFIVATLITFLVLMLLNH